MAKALVPSTLWPGFDSRTGNYPPPHPPTPPIKELGFKGWGKIEKKFVSGCFLALSQVVRTSCRRLKGRSANSNCYFCTLSRPPTIVPFTLTNTFFSLICPQSPSCTWFISLLSANTAFSLALTTPLFVTPSVACISALLLALPHLLYQALFFLLSVLCS